MASDRRPPDIDLIRATLTKALPTYMVPARLLLIDELPTSTSGKVDRNALPFAAEAKAPMSEGLPPETEDEAFIAEAFRDQLGLQHLPGVNQDFFQLGGDSPRSAGHLGIEKPSIDQRTHGAGFIRNTDRPRTCPAFRER